jgi:hypothetical protein
MTVFVFVTVMFYFLAFADFAVSLPTSLYHFMNATSSRHLPACPPEPTVYIKETLAKQPSVPAITIPQRFIRRRSQCQPHSGLRQRINFRRYSPNNTLEMSVDTWWQLTYPENLRNALKKAGFAILHAYEEDTCEWNHGWSVEKLGVERGVMHWYTVGEHGTRAKEYRTEIELVAQVENILYDTYPTLEICLIIVFLPGPVVVAILYWYLVPYQWILASKSGQQSDSRNIVTDILNNTTGGYATNEQHHGGIGDAGGIGHTLNRPLQKWVGSLGGYGIALHPSLRQSALTSDRAIRDGFRVDGYV